MTKDEALKLALEALEEAHYKIEHKQDAVKREQAITAIKEALAQPEQDWIGRERAVGYREGHRAALAQRTWVGLTKEERHEISMANKPYVADIMAAHEEELKRRNT